MNSSSFWNDALFRATLRTTRFGQTLTALDVTGSTNDLALEAAKEDAAEGAVFVARTQTHGRGRRGNVWHAAPGENLTFSLLARPERSFEEVGALPLLLGLAVREVLEQRLRAIAESDPT